MSIPNFKINQFENTLKVYCSPLYEKLLPPLSIVIIDEFFKKWDIDDNNLRQIFQWKNGMTYDTDLPTSSYDYTGFGVITSMQDIDEVLELNNHDWKESLFPLVSSFGGDFLLYETDKQSPSYGQLFLYSPNLGYVDKSPGLFDSLESMLDTISESFEKKIFTYDSNEMFLDIDYDKHGEIPKQLNPKSEYWDDY